VDYEAMSTPELQQECKRRGLPSGRAKADLVARLTGDDVAPQVVAAEPDVDLLADVAVQDEAQSAPGRTGSVPGEGPIVVADGPADAAIAPATVFRLTFPASAEGPSEDEHLRYRSETTAAAVAAGHVARGDARRVGTTGGREVYEVSVRRVSS
jgi:hypothetical protein